MFTAKKSMTRELYDWAESILFALIMVVVLLTFIIRGTRVDGSSMEPTLHDAQFLALTHLYSDLKYNDIAVLHATELEGGKNIIKRVIGLPGDRISIDTERGIVYRNGEALPLEVKNGLIYEDGHIINDYTYMAKSMAAGEEYVVPENHIFVMGDNRNGSVDSRDFDSVGTVDMNYVVGKVIFRITPFELLGRID